MVVRVEFAIVTLIAILLILGQIKVGFSSEVDESLARRAVSLWMSKTFLQSFSTFTLPSNNDALDGCHVYSTKKDLNFDESGQAGAIIDVPLDKIKESTKSWRNADLISDESLTDMSIILATENFKTMVECVHIRTNGEIVYGILGFVKTVRGDMNGRASVLFSFRKYKIEGTDEAVFHKIPNINDNGCVLWGQFCSISFKVVGLSDSENQSLFRFFRAESIDAFVAETGTLAASLEKEAERYKPFLPDALRKNVKKIDDNPDKLPTELFTNDPFTI